MAEFNLNDNIQYLKGVGEKRAKLFNKLDIYSFDDLLHHYPVKFIDYTSPVDIISAPVLQPCVIKCVICSKNRYTIHSGKEICKVTVADDTCSAEITFFNPYVYKNLVVTDTYLFYGKLSAGFSSRQFTCIDFIKADAKHLLTAIYPLTKGLTSAYISKCVKTIFQNIIDTQSTLPEIIPTEILEKHQLLNYKSALYYIHFPKSALHYEKAKNRFVFQELFTLQLGLLMLKNANNKHDGIYIKPIDLTAFYNFLPFSLTNSQNTVINEILQDMQQKQAMNRLLQGDVGSGKTLVAAACMLCVAQNGYQSVLMAPTEILAKQHAETLHNFLKPFGIEVALLTASIKSANKKATIKQIKNGVAKVIVATHAVLNKDVEFENLALCITDEQHRFGVRQRTILANKAKQAQPHILVMSATPIPRTLGLLVFGDLDISILSDMPQGRQAVKTYFVDSEKRQRMFNFIKKHIEMGRQAFIVCPLIEDSENSDDMLSVKTYFNDIAKPLLPQHRVCMLHGKMKAAEKAEIMQAFVQGEYDVLCSTTVIEVGVDVKNATVIVVENAERYGLSTLHQLRGRVGRNNYESFCILVSDTKNPQTKERLHYLCNTHDGFALAQYDMENRGVGDFFGSRQHGLPSLKLSSLSADTKMVYLAQQDAVNLLETDPALQNHSPLKNAVDGLFDKTTSFN